jgi:uncharacterized protein (DUF1697 family)
MGEQLAAPQRELDRGSNVKSVAPAQPPPMVTHRPNNVDIGMPRYAALLRGVSPLNAKMSDLREWFGEAGFTNVKTVLASGNVVFDARAASREALARKCEKAMRGKVFPTIIRSLDDLKALVERDPFAGEKLPKGAKRIVTFLKEPFTGKLALPIRAHDAALLSVRDCEAFSAYVPNERGPVFMQIIEKTLGKDVTTRTWDTVLKILKA